MTIMQYIVAILGLGLLTATTLVVVVFLVLMLAGRSERRLKQQNPYKDVSKRFNMANSMSVEPETQAIGLVIDDSVEIGQVEQDRYDRGWNDADVGDPPIEDTRSYMKGYTDRRSVYRTHGNVNQRGSNG